MIAERISLFRAPIFTLGPAILCTKKSTEEIVRYAADNEGRFAYHFEAPADQNYVSFPIYQGQGVSELHS